MQNHFEITENSRNSTSLSISPVPTVSSNVSKDGSSNEYNDSSTSSQTTDDHNVDSTTNEGFINSGTFDYFIETNNQSASSAEENADSENFDNNMDTSLFEKSKTTCDNLESKNSDESSGLFIKKSSASKNLSFDKDETKFDHEKNTNSFTSKISDAENLVAVTNPTKSSTNTRISDGHKKNKEKILEIFTKRENLYASLNKDIKKEQNLLDYIPGLYLLLNLEKDEGSNGLVNKTIISKESLEKLCNELVPKSFKSLLLIKKIINQKVCDLLVSSNKTGNPSLRSGIYLLIVNVNFGLVIHWPEHGCYEDNASEQLKKNMVKFHRYLTKLTDHQICLMSSSDLKYFEWELRNDGDGDSDYSDKSENEEDETCYEFEVKKSQEEKEDFQLHKGFKVQLPNYIQPDLKIIHHNGTSMQPTVVESVSHQAFITQNIIKSSSVMKKCSEIFSKSYNRIPFKELIKRYSLKIEENSMDMTLLKKFIEICLDDEKELLTSYEESVKAEKERNSRKKENIKEEIRRDAEIITNMAWMKLKETYSKFEETIKDDNTVPKFEESKIKEIHEKYPDINKKIEESILIKSNPWKSLKEKFQFCSLMTIEMFDNTNSKDNPDSNKVESCFSEFFYNTFADKEETDLTKLVNKHAEKSLASITTGPNSESHDIEPHFIEHSIQKAKQIANNLPDSKFVNELYDFKSTSISNFKIFDISQEKNNLIIDSFLKNFKKWRETFSENVKNIVPKYTNVKTYYEEELSKELSQKIKVIEKQEFTRVCLLLEEKFPDGPTFKIIEAEGKIFCKNLKLTYEIDSIQPDHLNITLYETHLEESENSNIQENELYVPKLHLDSNKHTSFKIDPERYELRKISQFENGKFLIILQNKKSNQIEIFFENSNRLKSAFQLSNLKPLKTLNPDGDCLFAINEPKGLIGIYVAEKGVLNVYAFDENQINLYGRNPNIQILQYYNNSAPDIKHFFFIKTTEELCFVETNDKAKIYNLVTGRFRHETLKFPPYSINISSTPDGSCIVVFVKEKSIKSLQAVSNEDDIFKAHVYFCSNLGSTANKSKKIVELPSNMNSPQFFQFSFINNRQLHLSTINVEKNLFHSLITKITLEKTNYRFQKCNQRKSIGQIKLQGIITDSDNNRYSNLKGKNTNFKHKVQKGEYIVIKKEKLSVVDVISNTELKVAGVYQSLSLDNDTWVDFQIEPKTKLNGFIDAYKLMFEKYPVESCIDPEQNQSLNLKIVLDVNDDVKHEIYGRNFENYVINMFNELKKPASVLKHFKTTVTTFSELDIEENNFISEHSIEYQLGEWIIQLSCLIPIQIAVAKNNQFQPLRDGLASNELDIDFDDEYGCCFGGIAENISLGWYEGIFKHFGNRQVKVVSSMGEQSCGKSYMLNHLVGTTFDGSAMRCTEGVWMSLVITKEIIYVALDFEGLKSLERTPQEDLFLTLFNTMVSNLILFKNQFAVSRDMSEMFQRFQDGATFFKSDSNIFQAKLCIIIKDVHERDRQGVVDEFYLRFEDLVQRQGKDNFIIRMYKSGLTIFPWPLFNNSDWFKTLKTVRKKLVNENIKYKNGQTFLQNIKVIMAKLKICDWGSLDENLVQMRLSILKKTLPVAISYGLEQNEQEIKPLIIYDTGEKIDDQPHLSKFAETFNTQNELFPDSDVLLFEENADFIDFSYDLRNQFEENIQQRKESANDSEWFNKLELFFKFIIERRIYRVEQWFLQNITKFPQDNSEVVIGKYALEKEINNLRLFWTLCGLSCQDCGLHCLKNLGHTDKHDCKTNHKCHFSCQFTEAHSSYVPTCSYKAGHDGKHACNKASHLCRKPCKLSDRHNCQKVCSKDIGHKDDEHMCQSNHHYCGEPCSLFTSTNKGDYECPNICIIPCELEHDQHHCENETCPIECPISDCRNRCQSNNHFHAYSSESTVNHFCGNDHQCLEECEEPGICKILTEPKKEEATYKVLIKESSISFFKYIQQSERMRCVKRIPPNSFKHEGIHSHNENGVHFCDKKCQFCEYYCNLPHGHSQTLHETTHGNMVQTEFTGGFTAENDEFEYKGHKLQIGDQGSFVLCNFYCKESGRHRHIDYCQNVEACNNGQQGHEVIHLDAPIKPNPDDKKDFVTHKLFWERTGFKDPYSAQEQAEFAKCDHECPDEAHNKQQSSNSAIPAKSYCELEIFHKPLNPSSGTSTDIGYISLDGHQFGCDNPNKREAAFHIIFALDQSGSICSSDRKHLENICSNMHQKSPESLRRHEPSLMKKL
nr:4868_t:CDS:10 [Entrophospora candida]